MTPPPLSRRKWLTLLPSISLGLVATSARADQALLSESDESAKAVNYVDDAAKVDQARFPKFAVGQTCANCALYGGEPGDKTGGCQLFFGNDVTAKGWCSSWEAKPR